MKIWLRWCCDEVVPGRLSENAIQLGAVSTSGIGPDADREAGVGAAAISANAHGRI